MTTSHLHPRPVHVSVVGQSISTLPERVMMSRYFFFFVPLMKVGEKRDCDFETLRCGISQKFYASKTFLSARDATKDQEGVYDEKNDTERTVTMETKVWGIGDSSLNQRYGCLDADKNVNKR